MSDVPLTPTAVKRLKRSAHRFPWTGQAIVANRHMVLTTAITEPGRPTRLCLTYDKGYHVSGWWKNGDYDECLHLSVSHPTQLAIEAPDDAEVRAWANVFFEEHAGWCWVEAPASVLDPYRIGGVAHARLFYQDGHPILPRGEVYNLRLISSSPPKITEGAGGDVR